MPEAVKLFLVSIAPASPETGLTVKDCGELLPVQILCPSSSIRGNARTEVHTPIGLHDVLVNLHSAALATLSASAAQRTQSAFVCST